MGATNTTSHYNLSQFVSTDKPAWLQDYNGDMLKIDNAIDAAKVAADTAQTTANAANEAASQAASDITSLATTVSGQGSNITALQLNVNSINSLIGNGTPTTTDQTIIGAINEINAKFVKVSGTTPSAQYNVAYFNYPTGFNQANTICVGGRITDANGDIYLDLPLYGSLTCMESSIRWYHSINGAFNRPIEIILIKIS